MREYLFFAAFFIIAAAAAIAGPFNTEGMGIFDIGAAIMGGMTIVSLTMGAIEQLAMSRRRARQL